MTLSAALEHSPANLHVQCFAQKGVQAFGAQK